MQIIVGTKEALEETRIALTPSAAGRYVALGFVVWIENGLGEHLGYQNGDYEKKGALVRGREALLKEGDIHLRVNPYPLHEISLLRKGAFHISFYDPFHNHDDTNAFLEHAVTSISMQMIPRTTSAQPMDAMTSQGSVAGYAAVMLAATESKVIPMMTTASGTISPAKVFVIGAGVAGLQAIATAKSLRAVVSAFDTRAVVEEQVRSLGAKFVKVDLGATGQTKEGYALELNQEQLAMQRRAMEEEIRKANIVITTAALFGKEAPLIVTEEMLLKVDTVPHLVVLDMAKGTGGNVAGSVLGSTTKVGRVKVMAPRNLPGYYPYDASHMYANNLFYLLQYFTTDQKFLPCFTDPILSASVITHSGEIVHERIVSLQGV